MARAAETIQKAIDAAKEHKATIAAVGLGGLAVAGTALYLRRRQISTIPKEGPYPVGTLPADAYDAVIVGAGPSGSVCAYYLAKGGGKVALLDKATFPRGAWVENSPPAHSSRNWSRQCHECFEVYKTKQ